MNVLKYALGVGLLLVAIVLTLVSEGVLLPFMLPMGASGLALMGVKTE